MSDVNSIELPRMVNENESDFTGTQDSPKDIWDAIKARHLGADRVREARLQTLMSEFELMRMKVFSYLAYLMVEAANLKKLDDKSQSLVHLGIDGSKAYRLYNPTTRRIVVSRDVVFDEKIIWSWNETL
ncbi:hypothetical protein Bca4012_065736 [Brassica carinata]